MTDPVIDTILLCVPPFQKPLLSFFDNFCVMIVSVSLQVLALNDSKFIGMAVYNVAAISAIGVMCSYALSAADSFEASYTVVCLCIILCTTVTLCLVFVPKVNAISQFSTLSIISFNLSKISNNPQSFHYLIFSLMLSNLIIFSP